MKGAKVETKVLEALSSLEEVKQEILKKRFGLDGDPSMSYKELAYYLTSNLSPEIKFQIVTRQNEARDEAVIAPDDIKCLEAEALRDLTRQGRRGTQYPV
jgi:hypothetical protein